MGGAPLSRREIAAAGLFALGSVLAILLVYVAFGGSLPFAAQGYRFTVAFSNAPTLVSGASVRISGVPVGKVVGVRPGESATLATIQLDPAYVPLPEDARAIVRNKTPLGESYVELSSGTAGSTPLPDGGRLPQSQVAATQQLSDVLGVFNAPTRRAFESVMVDTAAATRDEGLNLNTALGASGTGAEQLNVLLQILARQGRSVQELIGDSAAALHQIAAQPAELQKLITAGNQVTATTASRARALTATVRALQRFVLHLDRTDGPLTRLSLEATPALQPLVRVAPLLAPALVATARLTPQLRTSFEQIRASVPDLRTGLSATARLLKLLPPLAVALNRAGNQTVPLVNLIAAYGRDAVTDLASFGSALEPVKGTSGDTGSRYARTAIQVGSDGDLGFQERPPWSRYNPYPPPGANGDGESFNCANTANPAPIPFAGTQLSCVVQAPWNFGGKRQSFPDLSPYYPRGVSR